MAKRKIVATPRHEHLSVAMRSKLSERRIFRLANAGRKEKKKNFICSKCGRASKELVKIAIRGWVC